MKHFFIITLTFLTLCLASCDGKERARTSPEENITNSHLAASFFVQEQYIPEDFTEHTTDSILSNGYQVSIKVTTNENITLREVKKDTLIYKNYYRDFDALIIVKKNDRIVFNQVINKRFIQNYHPDFSIAFKDEIINGVWLEEFLSTVKNNVEIALSFCEPNSDNCLFYSLIINENGYNIKSIEHES